MDSEQNDIDYKLKCALRISQPQRHKRTKLICDVYPTVYFSIFTGSFELPELQFAFSVGEIVAFPNELMKSFIWGMV